MPELWLPQVRLLPIQQLRYTVPIGTVWSESGTGQYSGLGACCDATSDERGLAACPRGAVRGLPGAAAGRATHPSGPGWSGSLAATLSWFQATSCSLLAHRRLGSRQNDRVSDGGGHRKSATSAALTAACR